MRYFPRLAQRSGLAAPRGAVAPSAPAPLSPEPGLTEQNIEVVAPAPAARTVENVPSFDRSPSAPVAAPMEVPVAALDTRRLGAPNVATTVGAASAHAVTTGEPDNAPLPVEEHVFVAAGLLPPTTAVDAPAIVQADESTTPAKAAGAAPSAAPAAPAAHAARDDSATATRIDLALEASDVSTGSVGAQTVAGTPRSSMLPAARRSPAPRKVDPVVALEEPDDGESTPAAPALHVPDKPSARHSARVTTERPQRVEQSSRAGPVQVRIGSVMLTVQAPAPAPAPAREEFAPHRHYLRMW